MNDMTIPFSKSTGLQFPDDIVFRGYAAPSRVEGDVHDLEVVGRIPDELNGAFYRNSADHRYPPLLGKDIFLNLATSPNPTVSNKWTRHGPVFPGIPGSKSGALLLRDASEGPHFLYWGDSSIKITTSYNPAAWPADGGKVFIETRADHFDSKLVESGPPPLQLLNGDYIFFYNSATLGWPDEAGSAYHPGWVILDGKDPSVIKQRSEEPLLTPTFAWELGTLPYTCNVPNVVVLEAARRACDKTDTFEVYFGGADAVLGSAKIRVTSV